jgi:hypothetical protein
LTVPQVRALLQVVLPRKALDAETAIELIEYIQEQNYEAYCSHRRTTEGRLDTS